MNLYVNGEPRQVADILTVSDLLRALGFEPERPGIAVALNDRVVLRRQHAETQVNEGDRIEIIQAVQGG